MNQPRTHYDNLQIAKSASDTVIRAAYKALSQKFHPDKNPEDLKISEARMKIINEAYWVLSDPIRRSDHDEWIKRVEEELSAARPTINDFENANNGATSGEFENDSKNYFSHKANERKFHSENSKPVQAEHPGQSSKNYSGVVALTLLVGSAIFAALTPKNERPAVQPTVSYPVPPRAAEVPNLAPPSYSPPTIESTVAPQIKSSPPPSLKNPTLNSLNQIADSDRQTVTEACNHYQFNQKSAAYRECVSEQIDILRPINDRVDVTLIQHIDQAATESICSSNKFVSDPITFRNCIKNHAIRLLNNPNYVRAIN